MATTSTSTAKATEYGGKSRRARGAFILWRGGLFAAVTTAFIACAAGLVYLLLLTDPSAGVNLAVFYALIGFGAFFGIWAGGYSVRRTLQPDGEHPADSWPCTRQALLGASAVMISLFLLRAGWFGIPAVLSIALAVIAAEAAFAWRALRD